jgi:Ca-activated chloride channel family protein
MNTVVFNTVIFNPVIHPVILLPVAIAAIGLAAVALVRASGRRGRVVWAMRTLFVLACVAMLLRPGITGGQAETYATEADVFIVVDASASIVAEDWADGKTRLDGVREDVEAIADKYPGARFSLITFDSTTSVRLPLTTDTTALGAAMATLGPEVTNRSRGSSITQANGVLRELLQAAANSGQDRARLVFYMGDGEQTSNTEPGSFLSSAEYVGSGLVLGYGTEQGGPMRVTDADPEVQSEDYIEYQGEPAISVFDQPNLERIAGQLGVAFVHRSADEALKLPETPKTTTQNATGEIGTVIELYWIPAGIAVLLLAFELANVTAMATRLGRLSNRKGGE